MIPVKNLRKIARERLKESEILYDQKKFDGALYLCGYAVETALKARICRTLKWTGFPSTKGEFQPFQSFRTHDLNVLLKLSGIETMIVGKYVREWSTVQEWDPEMRYQSVGATGRTAALEIIGATKILLKVL
jgi:hypothetical protein